MAIFSAKRSPTALTSNKTLWLRQIHAKKKSRKQRESWIKRVTKKENWLKRAKKKFLLEFKSESGVFISKYNFASYYNTEIGYVRTEYGVYKAYNTYPYLIWKMRYTDTPPPIVYGVYSVPYNTYNYKDLAHPSCSLWLLLSLQMHVLFVFLPNTQPKCWCLQAL